MACVQVWVYGNAEVDVPMDIALDEGRNTVWELLVVLSERGQLPKPFTSTEGLLDQLLVLVNHSDIRVLQGGGTKLTEGDRVVVLPAMAGG